MSRTPANSVPVRALALAALLALLPTGRLPAQESGARPSGELSVEVGGEAPVATAAAARPTAAATVSVRPGTGTVGDRFVYSIEVARGESTALIYPDVVEGAAPFEVVDIVDHPPRRAEGGVVERRDYVLTVFETGRQVVPPLELRAVEGPETLAVALDSVAVVVASVLPDTLDPAAAEPRDIEPPVELPRDVWPYVLAAAMVAAAILTWWLLRKYLRPWWRRPREVVEEEPTVPRVAAHLVAFERLRELKRDDPIGRGDIEAFYVRATSILKHYVRDRYGVDVVDMTTDEVAPAMERASVPTDAVERLDAYLRHADLPKFARAEPAGERAHADLEEAWDFVESTRLEGEGEEAS